MASPEFENLTAMLAVMELPADISVEDLRNGYELMGSTVPPAAGVTAEPAVVGGVPGEWITPPDHDAGRTVLYLHGGGYVIGSVASHRPMITHVAVAARARVFAADYRLAPEHPFPAAVDDATAAYRGLLADGCDAAALAVCGDSAGGGLTVATLLALRDAGVTLPATSILISPWTDLTQSGDSIRTIGDADLLVKPATLERWSAIYLDGAPADAPLASPLFGELAGLPPLLIHVGDRESLLDDARRLAERAQAAGVEVELVVAPDMIHVWHFFGSLAPESADAIAAIGAWIIARTT